MTEGISNKKQLHANTIRQSVCLRLYLPMHMISRALLIICILAACLTSFAQPVFNGGDAALAKYLKEHIIYPEFSAKNCISGTVKVRFRVNKSGAVDQVSSYNGLGLDLDDEAVRVVKMTGGKWELPGGTEAATFILPIRFTPDDSHCNGVTKLSRQQAIQAYRNRQEQENVVTNYYQNKYLGKADTTKESFIIALKSQLGFDDTFIDDLLKQADDKRKQGDNEGACTDWKFIRNIGSTRADAFIAKDCKF